MRVRPTCSQPVSARRGQAQRSRDEPFATAGLAPAGRSLAGYPTSAHPVSPSATAGLAPAERSLRGYKTKKGAILLFRA